MATQWSARAGGGVGGGRMRLHCQPRPCPPSASSQVTHAAWQPAALLEWIKGEAEKLEDAING